MGLLSIATGITRANACVGLSTESTMADWGVRRPIACDLRFSGHNPLDSCHCDEKLNVRDAETMRLVVHHVEQGRWARWRVALLAAGAIGGWLASALPIARANDEKPPIESQQPPVAEPEKTLGSQHAQNETGGAATSFELMTRICIDLVLKHIPNTRDPIGEPHAVYVLMEFSSGQKSGLRAQIETMLESALEKNLVEDAVIAENEAQAGALWHIRHSMSEAINGEGLGARHDVSVATSDIPAFLEKAAGEVERIAPGARVVAFGHIGDGNVHYDVVGPEGAGAHALDDKRAEIESAVYDVIGSFNGSISAEHGVGRHRKDTLAKRKSAVELDMMRAIKKALDPQGIMNPGKML